MEFIDTLDQKTIDLMRKFNGDSIRRPREDLYPIATISALIALGGADRQLSFQSYAAYRLGFTREEMEEILIQNSIFSGFTRAMNAAVIFAETWKKFQNGKDHEA